MGLDRSFDVLDVAEPTSTSLADGPAAPSLWRVVQGPPLDGDRDVPRQGGTAHLGAPRPSIIKVWIAERLERSG